MSLIGPRTAFGNPVDVSKLPQEPLSCNWRVLGKSSAFQTVEWLVSLLVILLVPLISKFLPVFAGLMSFKILQSTLPFTVMIVLVLGMLLVNRMMHRHWLILGCVIISLVRQGAPSMLELAFAIGLLVWFAHAFRKHHIEICLAAPLPRSIANQFRKTQTISATVTPLPRLVDFWNATKSWFEYNPENHCLPGVVQSPAGSFGFRNGTAFAAMTLATITIPHFLLLRVASNDSLNAFELLVGIAFSHLAPIFLLAFALFCYSIKILGKAGALQRSATLENYWSEFQDDLCKSPNSVEQDSLMLGQVIEDSSPLLPTLKTANSHIWISGSTGAGKTALLMCLLEQYVHRGYSVLCLDLKATSFELYHTLDAMSKRDPKNPIPIWHFTNRHGWSTQFCSPFTQSFWKGLAPDDRTTIHLASMGLGFSRDYGESWFNDATYTVLDHTNQKYPQISSYQELHERLLYELAHAGPHELSKKVKEDGEHVALVIRRLKFVEMFNPMSHHSVSSRNAALDFGNLFTAQGLAYWGLNPLISAISASEISRVVLGTLLAAATSAKIRKRNLLLVIDEFQQMVAPGVLQLALRQARSLGITVLLLNQTVDDLKTTKNNFIPTVEANTAIQLWLNAAGRDSIDQIQRLGGKFVDYL